MTTRAGTVDHAVGSRGADTVWSDLCLGTHLTLRGGRSGWTRLALTAFGVALCAAVLLLAASVGPALAARDARAVGMTAQFDSSLSGTSEEAPSPELTLDVPGVFEVFDSAVPYRGVVVQGMDLATTPETLPLAPPPPGVQRFPGPGELMVSPALRDLLASPDGAELAPRLAGAIIGTIGPEGLLDPDELRFYRGTENPRTPVYSYTIANGWGGMPLVPRKSDAYLPVLLTAGTIIVLVPLLIFVVLMSRIGGPARDGRSAAIRLLGASRGQLRRITVMETILASAGGLLLGIAGYLAARQAAPWLSIGEAAFFPSDITPDPALAVAVVLLVPILAVSAVWFDARRVVADPLGVSRDAAAARRRPWPGLIVLVAGVVAMFGSLYYGALFANRTGTVLMSLSIVALLTSVALLLPWVLQTLVGWLPARGTAWLLAVRRLQLNPSMPSLVVAGVCVVLAGAIALQPMLTVVASDGTGSSAVAQPIGYRVFVQSPTGPELTSAVQTVEAAPGVTAVVGGVPIGGRVMTDGTGFGELTGGFGALVAPCAAIPEAASCRDGDVFAVRGRPVDATYENGLAPIDSSTLRPGTRVSFDDGLGWTVPEIAGSFTPDPHRGFFDFAQLIITLGALGTDADPVLQGISLDLRAWTDSPSSAVADQMRTSLAGLTWRANVATTAESTGGNGQFAATARMGLLLGAACTLLVAAGGLLVMSIEQLTARRRPLALTVAIGVPRAVIARSLLIGALLPVLVGVVLAVLVGTALSAFLLWAIAETWQFDSGAVAGYAAITVLLVLIATLPGVAMVTRVTRLETIRTG